MRKGIFAVLLLSLMFFVGTACAASFTWYVQSPEDDPSRMSATAVRGYWSSGNKCTLYLPAGLDAGNLRVGFEKYDSITVNGETLTSGTVTDLFAGLVGQTVDLKFGSNKVRLTVMQSANLNALYLTTESGSMTYVEKKKGNKESGTAASLSPEGEVTVLPNLTHIRCHGNGTYTYQKKPYEIKFEQKTDLYGMGKAKKWVLLSNNIDYSLLRNKIAYDMQLETGMTYAIHSTFVDLYLNNLYAGNYLVTEKTEIGENRIDIDDLEKATEALNDQPLSSYERTGLLHTYKANTSKSYLIPNNPKDITGGYLMEFELTYRYPREMSGFVTKKGQPVVLKSPKYASDTQVQYISSLMQELEDALFSDDGINPTTGKHYYEYIDKDSLVMLFTLEEVMKNYDANRSSLFFYKPSDDQSTLIYAGPGWDFDQSLDNAGYVGPQVTTVLSSSTKFHWLPKAYKIPDFYQSVCETYQKVFEPCLEILLGERENGTYLKSLSDYQSMIAASAAMNYTRWRYCQEERHTKAGKNFDAAVQYLQNFIYKRRNWLNTFWAE